MIQIYRVVQDLRAFWLRFGYVHFGYVESGSVMQMG